MSIDNCFQERKLRITRPDFLKARKSLEIAEKKLAVAEKLAEGGFEDVALVAAYAAMFHAGRALLFKDGVVEKSHFLSCAISEREICENWQNREWRDYNDGRF